MCNMNFLYKVHFPWDELHQVRMANVYHIALLFITIVLFMEIFFRVMFQFIMHSIIIFPPPL